MVNFMQYSSKHACLKGRKLEELQGKAEIKTGGSSLEYNDLEILKDAIMLYLKDELPLNAIASAVEDSIAGTYENIKQEELKSKEIAQLAIRGCRHDSYRKDLATFPDKVTIFRGDEETDVWCNVAFVDKQRKYVDCVIYMSTTPKFTKSGKNRIENYLPIYWLELMARNIAQDVFDEGTQVTTEAHICYLKKALEPKNIQIKYDTLDGKNFLGITNSQYIVGSTVETDIDKRMTELLDEFAIGHECDPAECERCQNNFYCNFTLPPEAAPEKETRIREKIKWSEAQQEIIDLWSDGY